MHVCRGVTTHGFAVNVECDLEPFSWITACGLPGVQMTSLERELPSAHALGVGDLRETVARRFCAAHRRVPCRVDSALPALEVAL